MLLNVKTFLLFILIFLSSCGDLFTREEDEKKSFNHFAICKMDAKAITQILTQNIKGELECLEHNLYIFIDVVESDKPGHLQKTSLMTYVKENLKDGDERTNDILAAVFDLNSLIFGADRNYMSKDNIGKLSELVKALNEIVIEGNVYEFFSTEEKITFKEHNRRKSKIYNSFYKIGRLIKENITKNNNEISLNEFLDHFKNFQNKDIIKYSKALLFVKRILVGGDKKTLSTKELSRLMDMFGDLGKIVFDFVDLPDTKALSFEEEEEILKILKEDVLSTHRNFYYKNKPSEIVFDYDDIKDTVEIFFPDLLKYVTYKSSFLKAKEVFLDSNEEGFTGNEINTLLVEHLYKNFSRGVFIYRSYLSNEGLMSSIKRIYYELENLITFNDEEESFVKSFNRIIKDYRFFQGSDFVATVGPDYKRNPRGIFDIMLYEHVLQSFFSFYGDESSQAVGDYVISQKQLQQFMKDFTEIFEGEGYILPGRSADTAETITLMTSLFHSQSDGDAIIEIPEFVEFINTMTSALNLSNEMYDYLKTRCDLDEKSRIHPTCYRENFINFLSHEIEPGVLVSDFVPGLKMYFDELVADDPLQGVNAREEFEFYLKDTGVFSRTCFYFKNGEEIPMKKGDFIVSWAGLLVVEKSIMRFDRNMSNKLEPIEVDKAYTIYKSAVKGLLPGAMKKYSKSFFRYLVKYRKVPETNQGWWRTTRDFFHLGRFFFSGDKLADANRMTFASILKVIAANSPARKNNPYNCDLLR